MAFAARNDTRFQEPNREIVLLDTERHEKGLGDCAACTGPVGV